ncbi:hypothetical protein B0J12DRAFT_757599 [Macrophomina phaseolina]|uniref:Short-chain dehydrogenase/reductase SDR n=1 Tax=Macrophomina phaseolina TaxID=35725 RepID=A0ABQ8G540_9PEZI|nr:hypothetical protein B0J12DRAFT_757599 [Macrophomina phaseolina]
MPTYLVTGASRGLGYAFLQVLASDPENTVCGLVRNSRATRDRLAADQVSSVHLLEAEITDEHARKRAAEDARHIFGNRGLDALINNAAYVSEVTALKSLQDLQMVPLAFPAFIIAFTDEPFSVFSEHDLKPIIQDAQKSFDINVFGVLKTVIAFLPLVRESSLKQVVVISSGMDFVTAARLDNAAPYAVSKAALSLMVAKLGAAYEENGILFMSLCPGLVDTSDGRDVNLPTDELARSEMIGAKLQNQIQ